MYNKLTINKYNNKYLFKNVCLVFYVHCCVDKITLFVFTFKAINV